MNYSGNMPDWHQYNASQTNEVTPPTQNVNSGHLAFIPGVSPPTLNAISLSTQGLNKHQNDANYNTRNFQSFNNVSSGPNIPNNSPLASMVQMQNCIGHYGSPNTRNTMIDNINTSVDPRNTAIGAINDEMGYRSSQVPFNGPIGHLSGPRPGSGSGPGNIGPRNTNMGSVPPPGKPGPPPSFIPCKGLCCNSDPNINYQQWEKFGSYQNNTSYRDNVHPSTYQMENRHFGNNCNFRKDNLEGKEVMGSVLPNASAVDHRRNFADYKYHKDHLVHRNYSTSSGMFHNYPMQGYNYSTDHQKYPYPMKEHTKTNNMNISNSGMLKHQEQNFIAQQKYNNKQYQYQNGNILPKGVSTLNVNANMMSSSQNPYFNSQFPRNIPTEMSHECQETTDNTAMINRMQNTFMHTSPPQHQVYQHKIAMQKFSMENHLREFSRIPGYQAHPKYKEYVLRYREVLKLQQSTGYQNSVQQASRVATPVNTTVPPINLQFDQNGMLINSSYLPDGFPKLQHTASIEQPSESMGKQNKDQTITMANEKCQQSRQSEQLMVPQQSEHVPSSCAETFQKQNQFSMHKDFNQNQLKVQTSESHSFDTLSTDTSRETMMQQKASKEFANKPDLDVRQFLANWDETDDEEGTTTNLPDAVLSETTPVVVVSYENVDLSSKTPSKASKRSSFCSNEALESGKERETNVITAQDCLTISYSSDNSELTKTTKRTIGEGVVKPGSIIHCISNGPDEIPTIHIVDNLEISNILGASNDQVIQTLEKQKTISFFSENSNNETDNMALENAEQQDKAETRVLPANYGASLEDVNKDTSMEDSGISETIQTTTVSVLPTSGQKNNVDVTDNIELKKQNSFEETHNPDDISLPDLPTSECTPISTTLNTPIHSDSEDSSQNMEDLSISTNPIEVMQNSPVISFTQLNSEEKVKNRSLASLDLEFQKENRYKSSEDNGGHEQEVTLSNFDFSSNSKVKSIEIVKNRQVKNLGSNSSRKKVYLVDGKESDSRISDTCGVLTSIEYDLEVQQELVEGEKSSERGSPASTHEARHKSVRKSTQSSDSIDNVNSNANLSPTESDDESQTLKHERELFRRKKIKTFTVSTNSSCSTPSEVDLNCRKRMKEAVMWEEKCIDKYLDKNLNQKRDTDHLRQSKNSDARKFDDSSSSQTGEHSVCHMTSQYKHYSIAVIKDNVTLSDKRAHGTTDRITSDRSTEFPLKINSNNTKELSDEPEARKHSSSKVVYALHDSVQSQTSKLLQKDLKTVDGDVQYTAEEIRILKEYRKKKEKLHQTHDTHSDNNRDEKIKNKLECSQVRQNNEVIASHKVCLEQNIVNPNSENLEAQEEAKGDKVQEHMKDSLEGIKIEINVSCTDRTSKGQEQNKRLLYDDRNLYEIEDSLSFSNTLDCQRKLHAKDQEGKLKLSEMSNVTVDAIETNQTKNDTQINLSATLKKGGRASLEMNEEISPIVSKETCNLTSGGYSFNKSSKDTSKIEVIDATNYIDDHLDTIKLKCAISNTAIDDANNKIKGKNRSEGDREDGSTYTEDDHMVRVQKQGSTKNSLIELSTKSINSLNNLDFNFDKLEYNKCSGVSLDRVHCIDDEVEEEGYAGKWKKPKIDDIFEDCDMFQSSSGYVNPIFSSSDKLEDLHTVPVYTTKDGKISYSPNSRFTYHELIMETRRRETCSSTTKPHYVDTWNSYYNSKFRRLYKKKRHHGLSERKKYEYKNTKYLYDRERNYSDEFCGRNHVKYKDYVHSIRNSNVVCSDHYKVNKLYKLYISSDSDEEIVDRSKNRIAEASNCKKNQVIDNKTASVSKLQKNEVTDEIDQERMSRKDNVVGDNLDKDKDVNLEETQVVQPQTLDIDKGVVYCGSTSNNYEVNLVSNVQSETSRTPLQSNEKENIESNVDKSLKLNNSELASENFEINQNKNSNNECTDAVIDKLEDRIIFENEEEGAIAKNESSNLKLLNEEKQETSLGVLEEKKDDEENHVKETDIKEEEGKEGSDIKMSGGQRSSLEAENNPKYVKHAETNKDLENDQINEPGSEANVTRKVSECQVESNNEIEYISQKSLEQETFDNLANETMEKYERNINEENILEVKEESIELGEEVEILHEEQKYEEENTELVKNQNDDNSSKDTSLVNQEEPESQMVQSNDSQHITVKTTKHEEEINVNSEHIHNLITEQSNFTDFSKKNIHTKDDNLAENVTVSNKDGVGVVLPDTEETSAEQEVIINNSKNESSSEDLPNVSEHEINPSRDSSMEKEMPILNMYCTIKSSPATDIESSKDEAENNEDKEKQCHSLEQVLCKGSNNSSESSTEVKTIPKLVIKKTDALSTRSERSLDHTDSSESYNRYDAKLLSEIRPKIPKMIIMKNRSRSATPTVEILEKTKPDKAQSILPEQNDESMDVANSDSESYTLKYNHYENKVPKVKIKLEDISSKDLKLYLKRKATMRSVPKVTIKKLKTQECRKFELEDSSGSEATDSDDEGKNFRESMISDTEAERIPKLKLKRHEESRSSSPEMNRGKDSNVSKVLLKKTKRTKEEDLKHSTKYGNIPSINDELKKFPQCIIEKIPKVIIKRTQIGAEFKCEISKSKKTSVAETSKWQPMVQLQRLEVLDHMVKDLKQSKITLKNIFDSVKNNINDISSETSINDNKVKLCRSNSVSNLSPVKCKQRRLSDSAYMKMDTDLDRNLGDINKVSDFKSIDDENRSLKRKEKRKLISQNKQVESENETKETVIKHSFRNILMNGDNDLMVVKKEYSSFGTKESTLSIEDTFLNSAMRPRKYDNDDSIIKVDSSDESQTTIEILPASPDSSEDEAKDSEFENASRINIEDAIPTQLELELELIDNKNMQQSDYASHSKSKYNEEGPIKTYFGEFQCSLQNIFSQSECTSIESQQSQNLEKKSNDYYYCNDLLVKEVLAAKETLKKCLTRPENAGTENRKCKPRTVAEKKQGLSFSFKDLGRSLVKSKETLSNNDNNKLKMHRKSSSLENKVEIEEKHFKQDEHYLTEEGPTASTCGDSSVPEVTTISLKASKKLVETTINETSTNAFDQSNKTNNDAGCPHTEESETKTNGSNENQKDNDSSNETKTKEDNMPLLVPEFVLNFDFSSDRDSSRSPPVITNLDEVEQVVDEAKLESKVISQTEKVEENQKHSYKDCEMTIADIITQLAYHEKATIKHKRYCNLCERWFPTTSRHRRHLAGYQHRYMELTQRKSIHALFILFTGKPCPRLLPANVIRNDCSIGELTPLQIAVQDVARCVEYTQHNLKMKE
ncbi:hypothetical protein WH47_10477 [Habropoda laboriosa]|uniref:C2H2-type domain-containing protein n=1 Tax=Habropoda laboriosa TaxID=597456 RepID=A0A0L7QMR1_9HYME|nr:hypothetical protein WH47_10477 [Habropoda laboriosa]